MSSRYVPWCRTPKARYVPAPKQEDGRSDETVLLSRRLDPVAPPDTAAAPMGTFQTDGLIQALESYIAGDPNGDGVRNLTEARDDLMEARNWLALDPPRVEAALNQVKKAMHELMLAAIRGADLNPLAPLLSTTAPGQLFTEMASSVDTAISGSSASAGDIAKARADYDAAVQQMAAASEHMMAGSHEAAARAYEESAKHLGDALLEIN